MTEQKRPSPGLDRILVAIDFDEASIGAAHWVADHFAPRAELVLAHVIEPPPATRAEVMRYPSVETIVDKAHLEVERKLGQLSKSVGRGGAKCEIRVGTPHEEIIRLAAQLGADAIVLGRGDLGSSGWARVGTTTQRVLRTSSTPILLVAEPKSRRPERILVAVDESGMTDDVMTWGAILLGEHSAKATVVHAAGTHELREDDEEWITGEIRKYDVRSSMEPRVTRSPVRPAESIIGEARQLDGDLIVIGSRGVGAADQMLFGSVAESVLLSAPCPVFVVLPRERKQ